MVMPMEADSAFNLISRLFLGSTSVEEFKRTSFRRLKYHKEAVSAEYLSIFEPNDFNKILTNRLLPKPFIRMAGEGRILPWSAIYTRIPYGNQAFENVVDISKVENWFRRGYTINVRGGHLLHEGLRSASAAFEDMFKCNVRANLYLTPDAHAGLIPHYDAHDVIALQLLGRKTWTFYENNFPDPTSRSRFQKDLFEVGAPTESVDLNPGDLLYVPRGTSHSAIAIGKSLHITFGIEETTLGDLAPNFIEEMEQSAAMRRSVQALIDDGGDVSCEVTADAIRMIFMDALGKIDFLRIVEKFQARTSRNCLQPFTTFL